MEKESSSLSKILQKLFSQKIIIKRMPGNRLKTIDLNKLQSAGNGLTGKFVGVRSTLGQKSMYSTGFGSNTDISSIEAMRTSMYVDYESMETDPILSAALDIYADESTVRNEHGELLVIKTDDPVKKKLLYNLYYDILNIEFNLWHWVRSLCKYGDMFLHLPAVPSIGIVDAIPIHPSLIRRVDYTGDDQNTTVYYFNEAGDLNYSSTGRMGEHLKYHEIAHFRVLTDTNYLPYGKSLLEGVRKVWKQLTMMEDAMLIHRIMRAPERRIFKVDVGNLPPESIDGYMEDIANSMKKVPYIDPVTGDYNLRFNLMNMLEDFYLPQRGGEGGTEIDTLAGLNNEGNLLDIEHLQKKEMAYLKIPRAYLGYDEGVEGKGTLAAEDIKFARFIERIQKIVVSELEKIGHIHLYMQGLRDENLVDFKLALTTPSLIYERQKVDLMNEKVNLIQNLKEQKLFSKKWMYENLFSLSPEEWKEQQDLIIEDLKREFREEQIKAEGNDPAVTGKSFGTPHDIVAMQMASKADGNQFAATQLYQADNRFNNPGRPKEFGSWESEQDPSTGRDPTGRLALQTPLNASKDINLILKSIGNSPVQLNESTNLEEKLDSIQMLNEESLQSDTV